MKLCAKDGAPEQKLHRSIFIVVVPAWKNPARPGGGGRQAGRFKFQNPSRKQAAQSFLCDTKWVKQPSTAGLKDTTEVTNESPFPNSLITHRQDPTHLTTSAFAGPA